MISGPRDHRNRRATRFVGAAFRVALPTRSLAMKERAATAPDGRRSHDRIVRPSSGNRFRSIVRCRARRRRFIVESATTTQTLTESYRGARLIEVILPASTRKEASRCCDGAPGRTVRTSA